MASASGLSATAAGSAGMGDAMAALLAARNMAQAAGRGGSSKAGSMRAIVHAVIAPSHNQFGVDPARGPDTIRCVLGGVSKRLEGEG